jgi:hypothetical protein
MRESFREGFEGGDVLACGHHLGHEQEADRRGQHVRCYACEVVGVVLAIGQLSGVVLTCCPVDCDGNSYGE